MKITIIGLGKTGSSLGLALAGKQGNIERIGHDCEVNVAKEALKVGAIDRYAINLHQAVEDADIVFLAVPFDQIHQTVELIAQDLQEGTIVVEFSPAKQRVSQWMKELLPPKRYYVGWNMGINPHYLYDTNKGIGASRQDYFHQGVIAVTAPPGTPSEVFNLIGGLIKMLGAEPLFADVMEMDGVLAEAQVMPQLFSALTVYTLTRQPGWREARKFAAQDFWEMGLPIFQSISPAELSETLLANRETAQRLINDLISVLIECRDEIASGEGEQLTKYLIEAQQRFEKWHQERLAANWIFEETGLRREDIPTAGEVFGRLIGLGNRGRNQKQSK